MTRSRGPFVLRQAAVSPASLPSVGKKRKKRGQPELSDFLDSRRTLRRDSGLVLVTLRAHRRRVAQVTVGAPHERPLLVWEAGIQILSTIGLFGKILGPQ